jgi:hypothetical protein
VLALTTAGTYYPWTNGWLEGVCSDGITFTNYGAQVTGLHAAGTYKITGFVTGSFANNNKDIHMALFQSTGGTTNIVTRSIHATRFATGGVEYQLGLDVLYDAQFGEYLEVRFEEDGGGATFTGTHGNFNMVKISD